LHRRTGVAIKLAYMRFIDASRETAGADNFYRARAALRAQLAAMGCALFDLGVLRSGGVMLLRDALSAERIAAQFAWLRCENARGAHIFIRPCGLSNLTLIDDLDAGTLAAMTRSGFAPALVVETSPKNFQAWLKHLRTLPDRETATMAARMLARRFGGDLSSADWRHFGHLAGFTNPKPNRRLPGGRAPLVYLRACAGGVFARQDRFRAELAGLAAAARRVRQQRQAPRVAAARGRLATVAEFHRAGRYGGDLHRADMAWALYAAARGLSGDEIAGAIRAARDLSKKGALRRQSAYAERTASKALAQVVGTPPQAARERCETDC
jgi:hypothetical protein